MINGFIKETKPLDNYERYTLLPVVIRNLADRVGKPQRFTQLSLFDNI